MELGDIKIDKLNPNKKFRRGSEELNISILDFWAWNQSNLVENRTRGILAEFIVMSVLNIQSNLRVEWDEVDFIMHNNCRIEVKSASFIQSWKQKKLSSISFDISPKVQITSSNQVVGTKGRRSDIYIFCLLHHTDQNSLDPMDLEQWTFYVLPTKLLNEVFSTQKKISLNVLKGFETSEFSHATLKSAVEEVFSSIS